jgi:hypothetical protein
MLDIAATNGVKSGSHQLEVLGAHFAQIRRVHIRGKFTLHQWNVDRFMSFFLRGIKGARKVPSHYFQLLRRPGRTAKLLYFQSSCGFDPHCLRQLSLCFQSVTKFIKGTKGALSHWRTQLLPFRSG